MATAELPICHDSRVLRVTDVDLRVADAERELCVSQLQQAFEVGRLDKGELEERVEKALVAKSRSELDDLTADCGTAPPLVERTRSKRPRVWIAGIVGALALGGAVMVNAPSTPVQASTCAATGLVTPIDVACPIMTPQQQRLLGDSEKATAAADQVEALAAEARWDERLAVLNDQAHAAAQQAQQAVTEAQVVVATSEGEVAKHGLDDAARKARSAAADAARSAIEATQVAKQ